MSLLALSLLAGCPTTDSKADTAADDSGTTDAVDPVCTEPTAPTCVDEMILDLSLHDDKTSDGEVTTVQDGEDFVTSIDASAHGYQEYSRYPWVYVKFGADGATRVDIDDESALESMDWDLALRRFIVRENSGDSGPSCVGAAALPGYTYDELTTVPDGLVYAEDGTCPSGSTCYYPDEFYTDDCTMVNDSSGLPGSPQVAIGGWWEYPGCLSMTGTPFLIQLADGSVLKMVVETYYDEASQEECDTTGSTTGAGGFFTIRWRWM
jgi:hypothetical protein